MTSHAPVSLSDQSPEADTTMPRRPIRRLSVETESSRPVTDTTLISQLPTSTTLPRRRGKTSTRQHGERGTATGLPLSTRNRAKSSPTMSYYALARVQRQLTDSPPGRGLFRLLSSNALTPQRRRTPGNQPLGSARAYSSSASPAPSCGPVACLSNNLSTRAAALMTSRRVMSR